MSPWNRRREPLSAITGLLSAIDRNPCPPSPDSALEARSAEVTLTNGFKGPREARTRVRVELTTSLGCFCGHPPYI